MPTILAVFAIDRARESTVGLWEKSTDLVDAARRQGFAVDAYFPDGTRLHQYTAPEAFRPSRRGPWTAFFRYSGFWRKLNAVLGTRLYDAVWLRAHPASRAQIRFLTKAKSLGCRVVVDLPTYPVALEARGLSAHFRMWLNREFPPTLIDRVVTLSPDVEIFGQPTIQVMNGVVLKPEVHAAAQFSGPYKIFGLGQWAHWHGVDRLLKTLASPELSGRYELCLAGDGPDVPRLRALAQSLGVKITWARPVYGNERETGLASADVGVGSLAIHRKGVYPDQALKHRQYAAAGLPFLATDADPTWAHTPGVLRLPNDDTAIDPLTLLEFLEAARSHRSSWGKALRECAEGISWDHSYAALWAYFHELAPKGSHNELNRR